MKARDIFGIFVRLTGFAVTVFGVWYLVYGVMELFGLPEQTPGEMAAYFKAGVPYAAAGLLLLRYARHVVRFGYPGDEDDSNAPSA